VPHFICQACSVQFAEGEAPPPHCPICEDERQFVPARGQSWTTLEKVQATHTNGWRQLAPGLLAVQAMPALGIGQRALLVRTPAGNLLWDCIALLDGATEAIIRGLGGLAGIAISHGTVAHWLAGQGALLSGDILQVLPDRRHLGFMRSYPCLIPLPPAEVRRMARYCDRLAFDAIYGAFHEREIVTGARVALARSAERYCAWVGGMVEP
jgi:hypothetical protein